MTTFHARSNFRTDRPTFLEAIRLIQVSPLVGSFGRWLVRSFLGHGRQRQQSNYCELLTPRLVVPSPFRCLGRRAQSFGHKMTHCSSSGRHRQRSASSPGCQISARREALSSGSLITSPSAHSRTIKGFWSY